jgi:hypothetical protein
MTDTPLFRSRRFRSQRISRWFPWHGTTLALVAGALAFSASASSVAHAQPIPPVGAAAPGVQSVGVFYDALAPYGEWIWQDEYGWVWSPYGVSVGWRPYSDGHWVYTDQGWLWESDLPWGWAAFHYGRWYHSPAHGWLWVPGSEWAPAWVEWRSGGGYFGWAPLPPRAEFSYGGGLSWRGEPEVREPQAWCFVPEREILEPRLAARIEYEPRNVTLLAVTRPHPNNYTVMNRRIIDRGPDAVVVERSVGHPVRPFRLSEAGSWRESRHEGETVRVYRPAVAPRAARPERLPLPPASRETLSREQREQHQREVNAQLDRYEAEQRRALAERHAREERSARAEQREEVARQHARERAEQEAEIARHRQAAAGFYERHGRPDGEGRTTAPRDARKPHKPRE